MPRFNLDQMRELESVMDYLGTAAEALCDAATRKKVRDLRYLIAEMRVLAGNPRDLEAINRFTELFTE
jgi:hypothetical protein